MKKVFYFVIILILSYSCRQDENLLKNQGFQQNLISTNKQMNIKFVNFLKSKNAKRVNSRIAEIVYDYDNVYIAPENGAYYVLEQNYNFNNIGDEQKLLFSIPEEQDFQSALQVGVSKEDNELYKVTYYTNDELQEKLLSVDYQISNGKLYFNNIVASKASKPCGDAVLNCIQGAYTHHGWLSVALWIETAFIPETSVAITLACAHKNCH